MHLVGFIIRLYHDTRSPERQERVEFIRRSCQCLDHSAAMFNRIKIIRDGSDVYSNGCPSRVTVWRNLRRLLEYYSLNSGSCKSNLFHFGGSLCFPPDAPFFDRDNSVCSCIAKVWQWDLQYFLRWLSVVGMDKRSARYVTLTFLHDDEWRLVNGIRARKQVVI